MIAAILGRRARHAAGGGDAGQVQGDGLDRRPADPVAPAEVLRALRLWRVRGRAGPSGGFDPAVFCAARRAAARRWRGAVHDGLSERRARLDGAAGRHRSRHDVGRPDQAPGALARRRAVHADLVRWPRRRRSRPAAHLPPRPWRPGDADRDPSRRRGSAGSPSRAIGSAPSRRRSPTRRSGSTAPSSCSTRACSTSSPGDATQFEHEPLAAWRGPAS